MAQVKDITTSGAGNSGSSAPVSNAGSAAKASSGSYAGKTSASSATRGSSSQSSKNVSKAASNAKAAIAAGARHASAKSAGSSLSARFGSGVSNAAKQLTGTFSQRGTPQRAGVYADGGLNPSAWGSSMLSPSVRREDSALQKAIDDITLPVDYEDRNIHAIDPGKDADESYLQKAAEFNMGRQIWAFNDTAGALTREYASNEEQLADILDLMTHAQVYYNDARKNDYKFNINGEEVSAADEWKNLYDELERRSSWLTDIGQVQDLFSRYANGEDISVDNVEAMTARAQARLDNPYDNDDAAMWKTILGDLTGIGNGIWNKANRTDAKKLQEQIDAYTTQLDEINKTAANYEASQLWMDSTDVFTSKKDREEINSRAAELKAERDGIYADQQAAQEQLNQLDSMYRERNMTPEIEQALAEQSMDDLHREKYYYDKAREELTRLDEEGRVSNAAISIRAREMQEQNQQLLNEWNAGLGFNPRFYNDWDKARAGVSAAAQQFVGGGLGAASWAVKATKDLNDRKNELLGRPTAAPERTAIGSIEEGRELSASLSTQIADLEAQKNALLNEGRSAGVDGDGKMFHSRTLSQSTNRLGNLKDIDKELASLHAQLGDIEFQMKQMNGEPTSIVDKLRYMTPEEIAASADAVVDTLDKNSAELISMAKEGTGDFGKFLIDVEVNGLQMLGDQAFGPLSLAMLGTRVFGNESAEKRREGYGLWKQGEAGAISAGIEVLSESLFNVIGLYGNKSISKEFTERLVREWADTPFGRAAMRSIISVAGEQGEEIFAWNFSPLVDIALGEKDWAALNPFDREKEDYEELVSAILSAGALAGLGSLNISGHRAANEQLFAEDVMEYGDRTNQYEQDIENANSTMSPFTDEQQSNFDRVRTLQNRIENTISGQRVLDEKGNAVNPEEVERQAVARGQQQQGYIARLEQSPFWQKIRANTQNIITRSKSVNRHDTATGVLAEGFENAGYVNSTNEDEDYRKATPGMENRPMSEEEANEQSRIQSQEEEGKRQAEAAAEEEARRAEEEVRAENAKLDEESKRREQEIEGARQAAKAFQDEQDAQLKAAQEAEKYAQLAHNAREFQAEQDFIHQAQQARQAAEEAGRKAEEQMAIAESQSQALEAQNHNVAPAPASQEQQNQILAASQAQTIEGQAASPVQAPENANVATAAETTQGEEQASTQAQTPESAQEPVKLEGNAQGEAISNTASTTTSESGIVGTQATERSNEDGTVSATGRESGTADSGSDGRTRSVVSRAPVFSGEHAEQHRAKWTETATAIEASGGKVFAKDELPPILKKASEVHERIFGSPITYYDASNMSMNAQVGSAVKNVPGAGAFVAYNHPALRRLDGGIANGPGTAGFHEGTHNRWDERGEGISRKRTVLDAMYRAHITKADAKGMANYVLQKYGFKYTKQRGMEGYLGVNSNQEWANLSDEARASRLASIPATVRNDIVEDMYEDIGNYLATNDVRYKQYQSFGNVADEMRNGLIQAGIYTREEIDEALREAAEQDEAAMAEKEQRDKEQAEYNKLVQEAKPIDEFDPDKSFQMYEVPYTEEDGATKKNLIAIHNCSVSSARHILSDGGKAMPSIAVSKSSREHSDFGEVSFILSPDSIDPSVDSHNKIYGGDAYTPMYDKNVAGEISGDIDGFAEEVSQLAKKFLPDSDPKDAEFRPGAYTGTDEDTLEDFIEGAYRTQIPIKAAIAAERGHDAEDSAEAYMFGIDPFLESLVSDSDVKDWLTQKFKKYGIKENFLEQQLKAMRMQPARRRPFLYDFKSLDELRSHKNLLSAVREHADWGEEAYKEARQFREYAVGAICYDTELDEDEARDALETIAEYQRDFTKDEDYADFFRKAYEQDGISPETIEAIQNALFASAEQPTGYFEAKPDRILPLDEFKAVLLPADQQQLAAEFEKAGVKAFLYKTPYLKNTSYIEDRLQHYKRILKDVRNVGTDVAHIKGWLQPHEDMDWLVGRIKKLEQDLEIASKAKTRGEIINEDLTQYLFEEPYLGGDATGKATDAASRISLPPVDSTPHTSGKRSVIQSAAEKQMATKGEGATTDAAMGEATYISRTNAARSETADHLTDTQEKADAQTQRLLEDGYTWTDDDVVIAQKLMFDMIKSIRDYQMHRAGKMNAAAFRTLTEQYNKLMTKHQQMLSEAGQKLQANYMFSDGDKIIMKAAQTFLGFTKDGRFAGAAPNAKNAKIYAGIEEAVKRISTAIEARDAQGLAKICKDISNIRNVKKMFGPLGKFADQMESRVLDRLTKGENAAENLEKLAYGNLNAVCDDVQPYKALNAAKTIRVMNMLSNTATIVNNLANNFAQGAVSRSMVNQAFNQLAAKPFEALTGQKVLSTTQRGKTAQKAVHNAKVEALEAATLMQMYGISENNGRLELNDRGMFNPNINAFEQTMSLYKFLTGMGVEATDQMQAAGFLKEMELGIDEDIKAGKIAPHTREQRMQEARHEVNRLLYKDDNATTALVQHFRDFLNRFSVGNEKTGKIGLGDITMAFAKIPANIVRARLAMTPEGALLQLAQYAKGVNKAKRMHAEVLANNIAQKYSPEMEKYRNTLNALYETEPSQGRTKAIKAVKSKISAINNQMWAEAREQCRGSVFRNLETIRNNYNENMPYDEAVERAGYTNAKEMSQFEAAQLSRKIGRAATSAGMMALGSVLRALGGLRDFDQEPDDELRKMNKDKGYQGLMFNANAMFRPGHEWKDGDLVLDGEFLEVVAMPLTIGATAAEAAATAKDAKTWAWLKSMAGNGIAKTFEAVGDIPGMADAINMYESMTSAYTTDYDEKVSRLGAGLLNYAANTVPSFFLPNSVSQAAAGLDNTVRDVYTTNTPWEQARNIFMNKFPVLRNKIPASVDVWGNERNYGEGLWGAVNKMLLPGDVRVYRKNKYETEIERLVKEGYGNATPKTTVNSSFEIGDEKYTMTAQEKRDFKLGRNQQQRELYEAFMDSDYYDQLNDAERMKVFKSLKTSAERDAKQTMLNDRQLDVQVTRDKWETELTDVNDQIQFLAAKQMANDVLDRDEADMDYKVVDDYLAGTYKNLDETQRELLNSTYSQLDSMYEAKTKYGINSEMWQTGYDIYNDYNSQEGKDRIEGGYKGWEATQMWTDIANKTGASEKQMKFFEDNMKLYNHIAADSEKYHVLVDAGWDRNASQDLIKTVADLQPTNGRKTVSYKQRLTAIAGATGASDEQKWEAFFEYCPSSYTSVIRTMSRYRDKGYSYERALKAAGKWDK